MDLRELLLLCAEIARGDELVNWGRVFNLADAGSKLSDIGGARISQMIFGVLQHYSIEVHAGNLVPSSRAGAWRLVGSICRVSLRHMRIWKAHMIDWNPEKLLRCAHDAWEAFRSIAPPEVSPDPSLIPSIVVGDAIAARELTSDQYRKGLFQDVIAALTPHIELLQKLPRAGMVDAELGDCLTVRGDAYKQEKEPASCIADCTRSIELRPRDPTPLLLRAQAYESLEQMSDALGDYQRIMVMHEGKTHTASAAITRIRQAVHASSVYSDSRRADVPSNSKRLKR